MLNVTTIRAMTEREEATLVEWAAEEGWNPGLNDAKLFWNLDPEGFLAVDLDGVMVGGGAIIRHNAQFGFMGLFIVQKPYRGQRLGTKLWFARRDRLLERLSPGATIGLDAVDQMIPFYERGGFRSYTRHRRFQLSDPLRIAPAKMDLVDACSCDLSKIRDLDQRCFPGDRKNFLSEWIRQPGGIALAAVAGDKLDGFGVMRPCRIGWKIGPLFANSVEAADSLFREFCRRSSGQSVFIDVPDDNPKALSLCQLHGLEEVFGCVRMYHGKPPLLDTASLYSITTLEVG